MGQKNFAFIGWRAMFAGMKAPFPWFGGKRRVASNVWAALGDDPRFRIVLAGYEGEHDMPDTWRKFAWSSTGAYKGGGDNDKNAEINRHLERLWFSPHCLRGEQKVIF